MKTVPFALRLGGLFLAGSQAIAGSIWFVDPNNSGPGDGSFADPYSSIQFALLQPTTTSGDTLEIFAGTFFENVVHPQGKDDILFRAAGNGPVVIDGMGLSACYRMTASFVDTITFSGEFRFQNGAGAPSSLGRAGGAIRISESNLVLDGSLGGITITGCNAEVGGGIFMSSGSLTGEGLNITGNQALTGLASGGGIYVREGLSPVDVTLTDSLVQGNQATFGGGIFVDSGNLTLNTTAVLSNEAFFPGGGGQCGGGGIYVRGGTATLENQGNVTDNLAAVEGGGCYLEGAELIIRAGGGVFNNVAGDPPICFSGPAFGGGVFGDDQSVILGDPGSLISGNRACSRGGGVAGVGVVEGVSIVNNTARFGGGVHGFPGSMELENCRLEGNNAALFDSDSAQGGGAHSARVEGCVLEANRAIGPGGGAYNCEVVNCEVTANESIQTTFVLDNALGGGLYGGFATDCTIEMNRAWLGGGTASCELRGCVVAGNTAEGDANAMGPFANGGGIFAGSAESCEISGNRVISAIDGFELEGGGAWGADLEACVVEGNFAGDSSSGPSTVARGGGIAGTDALRCELRGNSTNAPDGAGGGAFGGTLVSCLILDNVSDSSGGGATGSTMSQCTVVGNSSSIGAGGEEVSAISCIFFGNSFPEIVGPGSVVLFSLVQGGHPGTGNINQNPQFVNAAGGDYNLAPGSPCIDSGDPSAFDSDGSRADMGAFPLVALGNPLGTTSCFSNPNSTGGSSLLGVFGSNEVSDNDILLRTTGLPPNTFGFFIMSALPLFVPNFAGSQGILCLDAPQLRFNEFVLNSGPAGQVSLQVDLTDLPLGATVLPSETWYFQYWHRDSNPSLTSNTSSAVAVLFQ